MSIQIITDLEQSWLKVERAEKEWDQHLTLLRQSNDRPTNRTDNVTAETLAKRIDQVELRRASLHNRLKVLARFNGPPCCVASSIEQLLREHLPAKILGPETAYTLLLQAVRTAEISLSSTEQGVAAYEQLTTHRFGALRKARDQLLECVGPAKSHIEASYALQRLKSTQEACAGNVDQDPSNDEVFCGLELLMEDYWPIMEASIGRLEMQVHMIMATMSRVGVKVARQTLITEFLDK